MRGGEYPKVVVLHARGVEKFDELRESAGLDAPLSVVSFTDTFPEVNKYNSSIVDESKDADVVLIQRELLSARSIDARLVLTAALDMSSSSIGLFEAKGDVVQMLDHDEVQVIIDRMMP